MPLEQPHSAEPNSVSQEAKEIQGLRKIVEGTKWCPGQGKSEISLYVPAMDFLDGLPPEVKTYVMRNHIHVPPLTLRLTKKDGVYRTVESVPTKSYDFHLASLSMDTLVTYHDVTGSAVTTKYLNDILAHAREAIIQSTAIHADNEHYFGQLCKGTGFEYLPTNDLLVCPNPVSLLNQDDQAAFRRLGKRFSIGISVKPDYRTIDVISCKTESDINDSKMFHTSGRIFGAFDGKYISREVLADIAQTIRNIMEKDMKDLQMRLNKEYPFVINAMYGTKWQLGSRPRDVSEEAAAVFEPGEEFIHTLPKEIQPYFVNSGLSLPDVRLYADKNGKVYSVFVNGLGGLNDVVYRQKADDYVRSVALNRSISQDMLLEIERFIREICIARGRDESTRKSYDMRK